MYVNIDIHTYTLNSAAFVFDWVENQLDSVKIVKMTEILYNIS